MDKTANKKILEIRYEHYEEKRKEKVRILLEEWNNVIKDEEEGLIELDSDLGIYRSMHRLHTSQSQTESKILDRERKAIDAL